MDERVKTIFEDAESLYHKAIEEFARGELRDAAEKAWGVVARATNALILARMGIEIDRTRGTTTYFMKLIKGDREIDKVLRGRYFTQESFLHGHCFYMGILEPKEEIERWIKETKNYIQDARELVERNR